MQVGDLVKMINTEFFGIVIRSWSSDPQERYAMFEVYWSPELGQGIYFEDDLELICK
tara:strand:- start:240 stop:410 length:171 start_codon:yes stop_codon:yes gene_type:complete